MSKTIREHISNIQVEKSNLQHIAETGKINGSFLISIEKAIRDYSQSQTQELQEQNSELVEMLEDMETAWQSLPYGHNSVRDTQNWISNSIHPQILRMREWVSEHKTKHNHLNKLK